LSLQPALEAGKWAWKEKPGAQASWAKAKLGPKHNLEIFKG
jgi:hypothetical protein